MPSHSYGGRVWRVALLASGPAVRDDLCESDHQCRDDRKGRALRRWSLSSRGKER
jgi:hypothetical protein